MIRKVEVFGSDKTSVIWKKKKNVVVTVFGWDAKTSQAMDGATKKIAKHLVIRFARNMNFKL